MYNEIALIISIVSVLLNTVTVFLLAKRSKRQRQGQKFVPVEIDEPHVKNLEERFASYQNQRYSNNIFPKQRAANLKRFQDVD